MFEISGFNLMNVQHFDFFTDNELSNLERYQTCKEAMAKGYASSFKTDKSRLMQAPVILFQCCRRLLGFSGKKTKEQHKNKNDTAYCLYGRGIM
jgi:hypothetical protein